MNSNYPNLPVIHAIEQVISRGNLADSANISHPLISLLKNNGLLYNDVSTAGLSFQVESGIRGSKAIVQVQLSNITATGITNDGMLVETTASRLTSAMVNWAEYPFSTYNSKFALTHREQQYLEGNDLQRGVGILESNVKATMGGFHTLVDSDLNSNTTGSESKVMGIRFPLSTSQTVGGISQSAAASWQANVDTTAAAISLDVLRSGMSMCESNTALNGYRGVDLIILTEKSGSRLWSTVAGLIGARQQLPGGDGNLGFPYITLDGAIIAKNPNGVSGEALFLNTKSWFAYSDPQPTLVGDGPQKLDGRAAFEYDFVWTWMLGVSAPKLNGVRTNLTTS